MGLGIDFRKNKDSFTVIAVGRQNKELTKEEIKDINKTFEKLISKPKIADYKYTKIDDVNWFHMWIIYV